MVQASGDGAWGGGQLRASSAWLLDNLGECSEDIPRQPTQYWLCPVSLHSLLHKWNLKGKC